MAQFVTDLDQPAPPDDQTKPPCVAMLPHQVRLGDGVEILGVLFEVTAFTIGDQDVFLRARDEGLRMRIECVVPRSQWLNVVRDGRS